VLKCTKSTDLHLVSSVPEKPQFRQLVGHFDDTAANFIQRLTPAHRTFSIKPTQQAPNAISHLAHWWQTSCTESVA